MTVTVIKMRKNIISMIEIEAFGEKIKVKDWHERLADAKKWIKVSDNQKRILAMSPEELDEYHKKSVAETEANFGGSKERLAYYRSHGLDDCSDYPGGDSAFVRDVLAGDQREEHHLFTFDLKREDAYIYKCLKDGRFRADLDFRSHFYMHPKVVLALEDLACFKNSLNLLTNKFLLVLAQKIPLDFLNYSINLNCVFMRSSKPRCIL